jgi:hypothetical protein
MRQRRTIGPGRTALTLTAVLLLLTPAGAQDVTGPALKAAAIYNFAKFTDWPDSVVAGGPFTMCVVGDSAVGDALERAIKGRHREGSDIIVSRPTPPEVPRTCHVLYLSGITLAQAAQIVAAIDDAPVLTISDLDGFADVGGMVQLFFEHGQLRFSVALSSARRARLQISAKVLTLAIRK